MQRNYMRYCAIGLGAAILVIELAQPASAMDVTFLPTNFKDLFVLVPISLLGFVSTLFSYTAFSKNQLGERPIQGILPAIILAGLLVGGMYYRIVTTGEASLFLLFYTALFTLTTFGGAAWLILAGALKVMGYLLSQDREFVVPSWSKKAILVYRQGLQEKGPGVVVAKGHLRYLSIEDLENSSLKGVPVRLILNGRMSETSRNADLIQVLRNLLLQGWIQRGGYCVTAEEHFDPLPPFGRHLLVQVFAANVD